MNDLHSLFLCSLMVCASKKSTLWPGGCIRLLAHPIFSLSSLCRPIWKYWTFKMFVRYILSQVCLRLSQFSQLSLIQYVGLCVFSLPISLIMIVRICVLYLIIIIRSEIWPICHCLGLSYETMVCVAYLFILLIIRLNRKQSNFICSFIF